MNSTLTKCLRSLAYQMAKSDEAVLRKVLDLEQDAVPCVQWDERTLWRKLFVGCMFKLSKPLPQFWVIDALDECPKFTEFIRMLNTVPSYVRVFLTSRPTKDVQQSLSSLSNAVEHYAVQGQDLESDLREFVRSRMTTLPVSDEKSQVALIDKLLAKASGSFLWVSLIVYELEQAFSEEDVEEIIEEVPGDMSKLYIRMLTTIPSQGRSLKLVQSVLTWTLFSRRPLRVDEMQAAIKLDIGQTVHNLSITLSAICGQLLVVDPLDRVLCVHQTARIFLINQREVPTLSVDDGACHARMAKACLRFMSDLGMWSASKSSVRNGKLDEQHSNSAVLDYASSFFSDHLRKCAIDDSDLHTLVMNFLERATPFWLEYMANRSKLHYVVQTATNLRLYQKRNFGKVESH